MWFSHLIISVQCLLLEHYRNHCYFIAIDCYFNENFIEGDLCRFFSYRIIDQTDVDGLRKALDDAEAQKRHIEDEYKTRYGKMIIIDKNSLYDCI